MLNLIFNSSTRRHIGTFSGEPSLFNGDGVLVDAALLPADLNVNSPDMFLLEDGTTIVQDTAAFLASAKTTRKNAIKAEAAALIAATDWRLERARERETAGWAGLADVDAVLAEREAIRQSSSAAELAVDALTDAAAIQSFSWAVDVPVKPPRRLTLRLFMERFTEPEQAAILAAAETTPAVKTWWTRFELSLGINLDDPATITGVEALEALKLIGKGRAKQILA